MEVSTPVDAHGSGLAVRHAELAPGRPVLAEAELPLDALGFGWLLAVLIGLAVAPSSWVAAAVAVVALATLGWIAWRWSLARSPEWLGVREDHRRLARHRRAAHDAAGPGLIAAGGDDVAAAPALDAARHLHARNRRLARRCALARAVSHVRGRPLAWRAQQVADDLRMGRHELDLLLGAIEREVGDGVAARRAARRELGLDDGDGVPEIRRVRAARHALERRFEG